MTRARRTRATSPPRALPRPAGLAWLILVGSAAVAYYNCFGTPFVFDDLGRIVNNEHIRQLWPPWLPFAQTTRPMVQWTFALNHAVSGTETWSYHVVNVGIHALAGLTLHAVVRRTLAGAGMPATLREQAPGLALAAALLWVVHPLHTEAVTYTVQRAESMASLFYLLTLLSTIRGAGAAHPRPWYVASVVCCALGMASKPMMATAPLAVLFYDRLFLADSWSRIWRERRGLHAGLFATLALLPPLFANGVLEWRTSSGLAVAGMTPLQYAMTQPGVILHYLKLCLWPEPLVLDYAWPIVRSAREAWPAALWIISLLAISIAAAWRGHRLAFLGLWFFLILAPTSSFVPVADPAFEHRLYLPLAAVVLLVTLAGAAAIRVLALRLAWTPAVVRGVSVALVVSLATALTLQTIRRNQDYHSTFALWSDTAAKRPGNARAQANLGLTLFGLGRGEEALPALRKAVELDPASELVHVALGFVLAMRGDQTEALVHAREAVRLDPNRGESHFLLGSLLLDRGDLDGAFAQLHEAARLEPERSATHASLGMIHERRGEWGPALAEYAEAVRIRPEDANARCGLGRALVRAGRAPEARQQFETALVLQPDHPEARRDLAELEARP